MSARDNDLGTITGRLKTARNKKGLSREEVSEGILEAMELRNLEEGDEWDFWQMRILMGRLHVPDTMTVFYLSTSDNILVNLEMEICRNIRFWRYERAEEQLRCFYELCDGEKRFLMWVYYKLYAFLKIRQKQGTEEDRKLFRAFMEQEMPNFETRLLANKLYSPDELSLLAVYYGLIEKDTAQLLKKLYCVVHCFREEFVRDEERLQPFYAELMLACAKCQYELGDYVNCIVQCEEGIKVTNRSRICVAGGELYECMADAKGKLLEKEMKRNEGEGQWFVMGEEERKQRIKAILKDYMVADALYDSFYFGYQDGYKDKCNGKVERWRHMMQER